MKKYISGISAIAMALVVCSFTNTPKKHQKFDNLKWFRISGSIPQGSSVTNSNATYLNTGDTPTDTEGCDGDTNMCVAAFDGDTQVDGSNHLIGSQTAVEDAALKD